jgi:hypothetical protein
MSATLLEVPVEGAAAALRGSGLAVTVAPGTRVVVRFWVVV